MALIEVVLVEFKGENRLLVGFLVGIGNLYNKTKKNVGCLDTTKRKANKRQKRAPFGGEND